MNKYALLGFSAIFATLAQVPPSRAQTKLPAATSLVDVAEVVGRINAMNQIIPAKVKFDTYKLFPEMEKEDNATCDALWGILDETASNPSVPDVQSYAKMKRQELWSTGGPCSPSY